MHDSVDCEQVYPSIPTVQLKCKVMFACAYRTHVKHIRNAKWDAPGMVTRQVQNLVIKMQQDLSNCHTGTVFARCGTCPEHMRDASIMSAEHVWDACEAFSGHIRILPCIWAVLYTRMCRVECNTLFGRLYFVIWPKSMPCSWIKWSG